MALELPSLVWVFVDGIPRHVSDFAGVPSRLRPDARCPHCNRRLVLKLGRVRKHHAAHAPRDVCPATRAETALHLNGKLSIAAAIGAASGKGAALRIVHRCPGAGGAPCEAESVAEWVRGWDAVSVERRLDASSSRRPDIVLHRAGSPIGAVEIVASNAVSPEKEKALAALGVPWIEVRATDAIAAPDGWTLDAPLPVIRESRTGAWRCERHAAQYRIHVAAADARQAAEREAARSTRVLRAARVVDLYHAGGTRERFIYRVTDLVVDGRLTAICLHRGGVEVVRVDVESSAGAHAKTWPLLSEALRDDVGRFARTPDCFTDSPMRWARRDAAENIVNEALTDFAGLDPTPLATRFPRRWFYAPEQGQWFLPADMRDVRWDREPLDPFAAHPASARRYGLVRERPAPEGSWRTPVFARPPSAAMFRDRVQSVESRADGAIAIVHLLSATAGRPLSIVVIERPVSDEMIAMVSRQLEQHRVDAVWLSSPRHWTAALAGVAWAPAGRDAYGRGGVVIDGLGVFKADQLASALAKRDPRLTGEAIRKRLRSRVDRFLQKRRR